MHIQWNSYSKLAARAFAGAALLTSSLVFPASAQEETTESMAMRALMTPFSAEQLAASRYGMSVFLHGNPATTERDLTQLQYLGFGWQKSLFRWRDIEGQGKGLFDWAEADRVVQQSNAKGIKVLARLDYQPAWARQDGAHNGRPDNFQDFADFVRAFAARYMAGSPFGRVDAIQIWNEPNLRREWGDPVTQATARDYATMLKFAYTTIKTVDPTILVVTAGLSPTGMDNETARPDDSYLQWLYDSGISGYFDILGVHGNGQAPDPTAIPGSIPGFEHPSFYFRHVETLRAVQERNSDAKPMWLLEFGWTSDPVHPEYTWFAVSEEKKAENMLAAIKYARANWPWMDVMHLWTMPDPQWGPDREEYWWGLSEPDGTPRPAMRMLLDAAQNGLLP